MSGRRTTLRQVGRIGPLLHSPGSRASCSEPAAAEAAVEAHSHGPDRNADRRDRHSPGPDHDAHHADCPPAAAGPTVRQPRRRRLRLPATPPPPPPSCSSATAAASSSSTTSSSSSAATSATATTVTTTGGGSSGSSPWPWILLAVAIAAGALLGFLLWRRRRAGAASWAGRFDDLGRRCFVAVDDVLAQGSVVTGQSRRSPPRRERWRRTRPMIRPGLRPAAYGRSWTISPNTLEGDRTLRLSSPPPTEEQLSYSTALIRRQVEQLQGILRPPPAPGAPPPA